MGKNSKKKFSLSKYVLSASNIKRKKAGFKEKLCISLDLILKKVSECKGEDFVKLQVKSLD